ncbi:MAG: class II fructose-bisphosphate aldolase [Planctomycetaceae bacterium]|nr:class II fructose-bisphosphate aldolase [Planctomycetaceae bacterium]
MQSNLATLLQRAEEGKYAVITFNYSDLWDLKGIIRAAEEERAPIMVAAVPAIVHNHGVKFIGGIAQAAAESSTVPVVPHLDHSNSVALCMDVIDHGLRSVMIDASHLPFKENVSIVRPVVEYAHARGVHVEGELGRIMGANWEGVFVDGTDYLTDVREAVEFIKQTGVDSLAVGIGSGHGFYTETPHLNIERLSEIKAATGAKLVLHGGTGLPEDQIKDAIRHGINKINVGTLIYTSYLTTLKKTLDSYEDQNYSLSLFDEAVAAVTEAARGWIRTVGANGKA